jgi:hypothetical protein
VTAPKPRVSGASAGRAAAADRDNCCSRVLRKPARPYLLQSWYCSSVRLVAVAAKGAQDFFDRKFGIHATRIDREVRRGKTG